MKLINNDYIFSGTRVEHLAELRYLKRNALPVELGHLESKSICLS